MPFQRFDIRSCILLVVVGWLWLVPAFASGRGAFCASVPRLSWLSAPEVETRLREQGFHLIRLRMSVEKCYQAEVRDLAGYRRDILLHPVTAEIVGATMR